MPRFLLPLIAGLALAALAVPAVCGADPPAPAVDRVEVAGYVHVPEAEIRAAVTLKPGDACTSARVETDRKSILALGYFRSVGATSQSGEGKARVTFRVVEWPVVSHVRVLGNTVVEQKAIRAAISTQVGQVLRAPQLVADIRAIEKLYREQGYVARVAESLLDEAASSGILRFQILEVRIAEVTVEGASPEVRERAEKVLQEQAPSLYRPDAVTEDQHRLLAVRGVRHAVPKVEVAAPGKVRIRWLLNPTPGEETPTPGGMGD